MTKAVVVKWAKHRALPVDQTIRNLRGRLNQGRTRDLLLPLADRMEEIDDNAWMAPRLRAIHHHGLDPRRDFDGITWYYVWSPEQIPGFDPRLMLDHGTRYYAWYSCQVPGPVYEAMLKNHAFDLQEGELLLSRLRSDAFMRLAAFWTVGG